MRQNSRNRISFYLAKSTLNGLCFFFFMGYILIGMIIHEERTLHYGLMLAECLFINIGFAYGLSMKHQLRFRLADFLNDNDLEITHRKTNDFCGNPSEITQLVISDDSFQNRVVLFCDHRAGAVTSIQYKDFDGKIRETKISKAPARYIELDGIFADKPCLIDEYCFNHLVLECNDNTATVPFEIAKYHSGRTWSVHWGFKNLFPANHNRYTTSEFDAL